MKLSGIMTVARKEVTDGFRDIRSIRTVAITGLFGPLLIAHIRETTGHYSEALRIIAVIMLISAVIPFIVHPPSESRERRVPTPQPRPSRP